MKKRYTTMKMADGQHAVIDQTLDRQVSLPFPTKNEAAQRARELEELVKAQTPTQAQAHARTRAKEEPLYMGGQRVDISMFGEEAQKKITNAMKER